MNAVTKLELSALGIAATGAAALVLFPGARADVSGLLALGAGLYTAVRPRLAGTLGQAEQWAARTGESAAAIYVRRRFALRGSNPNGIGTFFSSAALAGIAPADGWVSSKGVNVDLSDLISGAENSLQNLIRGQLWAKVPTMPAPLQPAMNAVEQDIDALAVQAALYLSVKLVYSKAPQAAKDALKAAFPAYGLA